MTAVPLPPYEPRDDEIGAPGPASERPGRRAFVLGALSALSAAVAFGTGCKPDPDTRLDTGPKKTDTQAAGTTTHARTLRALVDVFVPGSPALGLPAASVLGADVAISRALAAPSYTQLAQPVNAALAGLNRRAKTRHAGRAFAALAPNAQTALVSRAMASSGRDGRVLRALLTLTLEGTFGHPRHGGNADGAAFVAIGHAPRCDGPAPGGTRLPIVVSPRRGGT